MQVTVECVVGWTIYIWPRISFGRDRLINGWRCDIQAFHKWLVVEVSR